MSITLTTPFTVSIGGVQVENDTNGAMTSLSVDFIGRTYTATFQVGTLVSNPTPNLNPGAQGTIQNQTIIITVNMLTGAWSDNHGHGGTIPGATLAPINSDFLGDRNIGESFMSVAGGLMPGTFTLWTQI